MSAKNKQEVIGPKSRKQQMFITSDADIVVFGGAASSGKSYLGVMDFVPHIKHPGFRGVVTRRTTTQLKASGGILDKAMQLFIKIDPKVKWKSQDNKFVFSSGAEIFLKHFEHWKDHRNWQGTEYTEILIDEGTQFEEEMVLYCMSRLRNPHCTVSPRLRITCNPDRNSYLRKWVDWWIDEQGFPIEERCGVKRYFKRSENTFLWGDSPEEVCEKYGAKMEDILSFTFINATVKDNPVVLENNPQYVSWLESLPRVERARLLLGNWDVSEEGSGYWKAEWCELIEKPPLNVVKKVRAWDISGAVPSDLNPNPDWSVGVLMSKDKFDNVYVEDVVRFQARHGEVYQRMLETAKADGAETMISVPIDPGAAGKHYASTLIGDLASEGFYAKGKTAQKSKVQRFAPFCAASESGRVKIVKAEWNEAYILELETFDGNRKNKDD